MQIPPPGDWNTAANWTPTTVPNGADQTATFDFTATPMVNVTQDTEIGTIAFTQNASAYSISLSPDTAFSTDDSISNNSTVEETFLAEAGPFGTAPEFLEFFNSADAGTMTIHLLSGEAERGDIAGAADPVLELYDANGQLVVSNDNWKDSQAKRNRSDRPRAGQRSGVSHFDEAHPRCLHHDRTRKQWERRRRVGRGVSAGPIAAAARPDTARAARVFRSD